VVEKLIAGNVAADLLRQVVAHEMTVDARLEAKLHADTLTILTHRMTCWTAESDASRNIAVSM